MSKEENLYPNYYGANNKEDLLSLYKNGLLDNCSSFEAFCYGNVIKYIVRHTGKNGINDLNKAKVYLTKIQESYEDDKQQGKESEVSINNSKDISEKYNKKISMLDKWYASLFEYEDYYDEIRIIINEVIKIIYEKEPEFINHIIKDIEILIDKENKELNYKG